MKTQTVSGFTIEHRKAYPSATNKRIYARPFTKIVPITKPSILDKILED